MAIQTVIPGRKGRRDLMVDRLKEERDSAESLALEELELKQRLQEARDPLVEPKYTRAAIPLKDERGEFLRDEEGGIIYDENAPLIPQGQIKSPDVIENRLDAIAKRRKKVEEDFSRILETPSEELEGRLPGISDEEIITGVDKQLRQGAAKTIVGSGTPIQLDVNDNIVDPYTGEAIDYTGQLNEQLENERLLLEEASVDLSPEYLSRSVEDGRVVSPFSDLIGDSGFVNFLAYDDEIAKGLEATKTAIPGQRETFDPAMKTIRELLDIPETMSNEEVTKGITLSLLTVAEGAYGKQQVAEVDQDNVLDMEAQAQEFLAKEKEELEGLGLEVLEGGGISQESFINMFKTQLRNRILTQPIINEDNMLVQKTPIDEDALQQAAEIALNSILDTGTIREGSVKLVQEKVNGRMQDIQGYNPSIPVYFFDANAYKIVRDASDFIRYTDKSRLPKKSSLVPGGKKGAFKNQGKVFGAQKGKAAENYEQLANNVAFFVDNQSLAFAAAMLQITDLIRQNPEAIQQIDGEIPGLTTISDIVMNTKLFKNEAGLSDKELAALQQARLQEATMSQLAVGDATQIFIKGMQVYPQHTTDLMNMRLRNTEMDMNPQRSKIHRGVMVSGRPLNVNISFKNRTIQANESVIPQPIIAQINERVKKQDYTPLTAGELEASHLFVIAYNLLPDVAGIDPSGLSEETILSYITPEFLNKAAEVGRVFNNVFPKDINKDTFQDVDLMQDKVMNGFTTLFPEEKALLAQVLPKLAKGDWGYKFKSYIAAADYLDSTGSSITSRVTLEYDYNSAGLSFMQVDAGRKQFLSYVGIISGHLQDGYGDALAAGTPRNLFLDEIIEELQSSEISASSTLSNRPDSHRIADALSDAKLNANSKKELIGMAKSILLTIGYAKPSMFQHENIRGILETVPELANLQAQGVDVVNVLNYVVSTSVRKIIDTKYATKAKQATKILTMMGIPAHIETDDGMQVPLFKSKLAPIEGATPIEVVSSGGKVTLVTQKEKVPNLREQGKPKDVDGKKIIPATGASIANRPMAITAQARETMSLRDSVNVVNKGHNRENVPVWFSTTFDNISSDAGGAFYYRTAMNGDPVRKALAFNSTAAYLKTAAKNIANFSEVIPDIVEINKKSPYGTLLEEIQLTKKRYEGDDTVDDLAQQALDEKTRPKTKKFLEFLKNHPSDNVRKLFETGPESDETIFLSKKEFSNVMANYLASQDLSIESFRIAANNSQAASDETMLVISRQARLAFAG